MRAAKKAEREAEKLKAWLASKGHDVSTVEKALEESPDNASFAVSMQGEAVLLFLEKPARFTFKDCKLCGVKFGTNYRSVAYCSDAHRATYLRTQYGIGWNPHKKPEERWGGEPPLVIPPEAVQALLRIVEFQPQTVQQIQTATVQVSQKFLERNKVHQSEVESPAIPDPQPDVVKPPVSWDEDFLAQFQ